MSCARCVTRHRSWIGRFILLLMLLIDRFILLLMLLIGRLIWLVMLLIVAILKSIHTYLYTNDDNCDIIIYVVNH